MSNVYDFNQARRDYDATAQINTTQDVSPDDAARAFEQSKVTGVPASLIAANKEQFEKDYGGHFAGQIIQNNPHLADFVNSDPLHGPLVKDDLSNLDRLSQQYDKLGAADAQEEAARRLARGVIGPRTPAGQIYGEGLNLQTAKLIVGFAAALPKSVHDATVDLITKAATGQLHQELSEGNLSPETVLNAGTIASLGATGGIPQVTSEGAVQSFLKLAEGLKPPSPRAQAMGEAVQEGVRAAEAARPPQPALMSPELSAAMQKLDEELRNIKPWTEAGQEPPVGVSQMADAGRLAQTEQDQELIKGALDAANATELKERSPEKFREFLGLHQEGTLTIDKEAVAAEPNKWEWVPNLERQLTAPGGTIQVSAKDFLTNFDKADWDAVKDFIAREDHLSKNQFQVYHGSPADFDQFSSAFRKTGQGATTYGEGHYVAQEGKVAEDYQKTIGGKLDPEEHAAKDALDIHNGDRQAALQEVQKYIDAHESDDTTVGKQALEKYTRARQLLEQGWEPPKGNLYTVRVLRPEGDFLDRDLTLRDQPLGEVARKAVEDDLRGMREKAKGRIEELGKETSITNAAESGRQGSFIDQLNYFLGGLTNSLSVDRLHEIYESLGADKGELEDVLNKAGIAGFKYLDQFSRRSESEPQTRNFVVFNDKDLQITHKNGVPVRDAERAAVHQEALERQPFARGKSGRPIATKPLGNTERLLQGIQQAVGLTPAGHPIGPFTKGTDLGVTQKELDRLYKLIEKQTTGNQAWVNKRNNAQAALEKSNKWKAEYAKFEPLIRAEVEQRPIVQAWQRLQKLKLDPQELTPIQAQALPSLVGPGGLHPDAAAGMFDYPTGDELIRALRSMEQEAAKTKGSIVDRLVKAELTDLLNTKFNNTPEDGLNAAIDHVLSPTTMEMLHEHMLAALSRLGGAGLPPSKSLIKWAAANYLGERPLHGTTAIGLMKDAYQAARRIQKAEAAGDANATLQGIQDQYLLVREAMEMRVVEKERKEFNRIAKRFRNREVAGMPFEHTTFIHDILRRIGQEVHRTQEDLNEYLTKFGGLDKFVDDLEHVQGWDVPVWDKLRDPSFTKDLSKMSIQEFRNTLYSLRTLAKRGANEAKVAYSGKMIDLHDLIEQGTEGLRELPRKNDPASSTKTSKILRTARTYYWAHISTESIINRWMDGDPKGILSRALIYPMADGANYRSVLIKDVDTAISKLGPLPPKLTRKVNNDLFMNPDHAREGVQTPLNMKRLHLLSVLANLGNESNASKLALGWGIRTPDGGPDIDRIKNWVWRELGSDAPAYINWMQKFADRIFKPLKELADAKALEESEVPAENIPLEGFIGPDGKAYKGWYFPLIPHEHFEGVVQARTLELETRGYLRAATPRGYTKQRTGAIYPLSLDFARTNSAITEIIHDIALRAPVREFAKVLRDPNFRAMVRSHYNKEVLDNMETWLKAISNSEIPPTAAWQTFNNVLNFFHRNIVGNVINLNISTPMKHFVTATANTVTEIGPLNFLKASAQLASDLFGADNIQFVHENSMEIQRRDVHWDQSLYGTMEAVKSPFQGKLRKLGDWYRYIASTPIRLSDSISTYQTWLATFQREYEKSFDKALAIQIADRAVARAHGSSNIARRPTIMLGGPLAQNYTSFYTLINALMQREFEGFWQAKEGTKSLLAGDWADAWKRYSTKALPYIFAAVVVPGIVEYYVTRSLEGDDNATRKRLGWAYWPVKLGAVPASLTFIGVRDLVYSLESGFSNLGGVLGTGAQQVWNAMNEVVKAQHELSAYGKLSDKEISDLIERVGGAAGVTTGGVPGASPAKTVAGIHRKMTGQEVPQDWWQLFRLLFRGHTEPLKPRRTSR